MVDAEAPITSRWQTRALDLGLIAITAPLWAPALATISVVVAISSGRPILFRQRRVGRCGVSFSMLKFRSMTNGDNPLVPDPAKITPIGHLLRRTSLDELPQILNVLAGHMSLVGPRPMLPCQAAEMTTGQQQRHRVRPGVTGLAQVNGRNMLSWNERFDYDLAWAAKPSPILYLRILFRTVTVVVTGSGVDGHDAKDPFVDVEPKIIRLVDFDLTNDPSTVEQRAA